MMIARPDARRDAFTQKHLVVPIGMTQTGEHYGNKSAW